MTVRQPDGAVRPLLTTKLHIPQPRRDLVSRPHLFDRLHEGLGSKLTLISAPAGFGKTTLVSQWIAAWAAHHAQACQFAWLALDAGDNDPVRFWRYVITACQTFSPTLGHSALALLHTPQPPAWETVLTLFINDLAQLSTKGVLVLEDYHVLTAPVIHEMIGFLLDHLPATFHLIITTRVDPPLPLARLRAQSTLNELRLADLRFSLDETEIFLQHALAYPLTPAMLAQLDTRTEGWITALRLVALMRQGRPADDAPPIEQLLSTLTGSRGHIFAYLIAEVLTAQPPEVQDFLLRTSVLERLTGPLCDAVLERHDSEQLLEALADANMFLVTLDDNRQQPPSGGAIHSTWYRYHALFAEAMQQEVRRRLGEASLRALLSRASYWYAQQGLLTEAIEAALAAQDFAFGATLIERSIAPELGQNEWHTVRRWIAQVPAPLLPTYPALCLPYAIAILFTSDRRAPATMALIQTPLQIAEAHWRAVDEAHKLGEVLAFRAWITRMQGDNAQALPVAKQALTLLPATETQWRGVSLTLVGEETLLAGNLQEARHTFAQAVALWQATQNAYGILANTIILADVCAKQGELHQAARLYQQVLVDAPQASMNRNQRQMRMGAAQVGLAALALERNDLATAEQQATAALTIGQQVAYLDLQVRSTLILVRSRHARGETIAAQQQLYELIAQTPPGQSPVLLREARAWQARLALATGDLATAERWQAATQPDAELPRLQQEQEALLVARLALAQNKADAALRLLAPWQAEAHDQGRSRSRLEILVLQSLAQCALPDHAAAGAALLQAVAAAHAEGYQRLFLDEGATMVALLRMLLTEIKTEPLLAYVRGLLLTFAQQQPDPTPHSTAKAADVANLDTVFLVEPLSPQERRVLQLLAAGLSNGEIAKELIVSINTVKTQTQSIYRKLNVNSRQAARAAARHLNLG